ncbi:hypothetical protein LEP1GSC121_0999 [Leptospira borgpetersenii serovar Castellonis str. 200801910]|uniref:Uncharacterized protein n=1 Tax=Leptospira borgpetersenii serovar Ballum TaxID=280505 RepID=A0A0S2IN04_LEPBO|nr:hypothetical protein LBBP_00724 [Leptospira borgpetersenii serovar Ballum]EKR02343.1 hypothetical protein LEP1GSC121_0999 [Leptospira borgpetersenii serovar Castellonis str. 200801910]
MKTSFKALGKTFDFLNVKFALRFLDFVLEAFFTKSYAGVSGIICLKGGFMLRTCPKTSDVGTPTKVFQRYNSLENP